MDSVDVHMSCDGNEIEVEIADQGNGFVLGSQPKGSGLGIYGMKERLKSLAVKSISKVNLKRYKY